MKTIKVFFKLLFVMGVLFWAWITRDEEQAHE